jgi:hypothetical protein
MVRIPYPGSGRDSRSALPGIGLRGYGESLVSPIRVSEKRSGIAISQSLAVER